MTREERKRVFIQNWLSRNASRFDVRYHDEIVRHGVGHLPMTMGRNGWQVSEADLVAYGRQLERERPDWRAATTVASVVPPSGSEGSVAVMSREAFERIPALEKLKLANSGVVIRHNEKEGTTQISPPKKK